MKKVFLGLAAMALIFTSCNEDGQEITETQELVDMSDFYLHTEAEHDEASRKASNKDAKSCYSMVNLNRLLNENPDLYKKMYNIEKQTRSTNSAKGKPGSGGGTDPAPAYTSPVTIPVIVNIIETSAGRVTTQQINSQIAVLTTDFNNNNNNVNNIPTEFADKVANTEITFTLDKVIRVVNSKTAWGTNDAMKYASQGGIDVTTPSTHLNIWVCEIGGGILGYAQFPGGPTATDGVVIGTDYFGQTGGVYGQGRTATHEVGHWLNLRHIWGDGRCRQDDFVVDTPSSDGPNYACPSYPTVNCQSADMTMNYMDYVYDDCMYMFSKGQNSRMRALFVAGAARASLVGN